MADLTPYALRLPPEMKDAAKAMSKIRFSIYADGATSTSKHYSGNSINDALNHLLRCGVADTIKAMQPEIQETIKLRDFWQGAARFFIENHDRDHANAEDFEGDMRREIEARDAEVRRQNEEDNDGYDLDNPTDSEFCLGFYRENTMEKLAYHQRRLTDFRGAEKALRAAIA